MMPRTAILPSLLIDTQAWSLARTTTSNGSPVAAAAFAGAGCVATPAGTADFALSNVVAGSLLAGELPVVAGGSTLPEVFTSAITGAPPKAAVPAGLMAPVAPFETAPGSPGLVTGAESLAMVGAAGFDVALTGGVNASTFDCCCRTRSL